MEECEGSSRHFLQWSQMIQLSVLSFLCCIRMRRSARASGRCRLKKATEGSDASDGDRGGGREADTADDADVDEEAAAAVAGPTAGGSSCCCGSTCGFVSDPRSVTRRKEGVMMSEGSSFGGRPLRLLISRSSLAWTGEPLTSSKSSLLSSPSATSPFSSSSDDDDEEEEEDEDEEEEEDGRRRFLADLDVGFAFPFLWCPPRFPFLRCSFFACPPSSFFLLSSPSFRFPGSHTMSLASWWWMRLIFFIAVRCAATLASWGERRERTAATSEVTGAAGGAGREGGGEEEWEGEVGAEEVNEVK